MFELLCAKVLIFSTLKLSRNSWYADECNLACTQRVSELCSARSQGTGSFTNASTQQRLIPEGGIWGLATGKSGAFLCLVSAFLFFNQFFFSEVAQNCLVSRIMVAVVYKSKSIQKKEHVSVFLLKDSYSGKKTHSVNCYSQLQAVTSFLLSVARANRLGLCEQAELCCWDFWGAGLCQPYPIPLRAACQPSGVQADTRVQYPCCQTQDNSKQLCSINTSEVQYKGWYFI